MEIGFCTGFCKKSDDLATVRQLLKWGIRKIDYGYNSYTELYQGTNWQEHARELKALLDEFGAEIHQIHAPWIRYLDEEKNAEKKREAIRRGIELCGFLGCPVYVMHPIKFKIPQLYTAKDALEANVELFSSLAPLAKEHHVRIALENLYRYDPSTRQGLGTGCNTAKELLAMLDRLDRDVFGICLDSGHALINDLDPAAMIREIGSDLLTVHLHDNDRYTDAHLPMTYGVSDWPSIVEALREVGYSGVFSLEIVARDPRFAELEAQAIMALAHALLKTE